MSKNSLPHYKTSNLSSNLASFLFFRHSFPLLGVGWGGPECALAVGVNLPTEEMWKITGFNSRCHVVVRGF